jgi:two-component system OmpR family response regulator
MAQSLKASLTADEHDVEIAGDGELGESMAMSGGYDVIVLDRMLPKKLGVSVIKDLRDQGLSTPVLMLSALHDEDHRVEGLEAGANDYLGKPYSTRELLARVKALWNGRGREAQTRLQVGDLEMDLLARIVKRGGKKLDLQPREFRLLEYLMRNSGQTVTRKMLLEKDRKSVV